MKTYSHDTFIQVIDTGLATGLLRFIGALILYLCFGMIADTVYANDNSHNPSEPTQGSVWLLAENSTYINALLLETDAHFDVSGMIARASIKQHFKNTSNLWAEGIYVFPLPENAAVDHFTLRIGDRLIQGNIQERETARKTYQAARSEGRKAGLIEQQRANIFKTSLANIAPDEEITIEFEYQQTLDYRDGRYQLRFPMVAGPRFHAASRITPGSKNDTDVSTFVSDEKINPVHIHVSLDSGVDLTALESISHPIDIKQTDTHRYSIALASARAYADRDFELVWQPDLSGQPQTAVFKETYGGYEYILLSVLPPDLQSLGQQLLPRDVIFILDVSGSMAGTSIEQAKASLIQALRRLKPEDRFNIIWFNDRTERLYPRSIPADDHALEYASSFIGSLDADGGTVMQPAIALALNDQPD